MTFTYEQKLSLLNSLSAPQNWENLFDPNIFERKDTDKRDEARKSKPSSQIHTNFLQTASLDSDDIQEALPEHSIYDILCLIKLILAKEIGLEPRLSATLAQKHRGQVVAEKTENWGRLETIHNYTIEKPTTFIARHCDQTQTIQIHANHDGKRAVLSAGSIVNHALDNAPDITPKLQPNASLTQLLNYIAAGQTIEAEGNRKWNYAIAYKPDPNTTIAVNKRLRGSFNLLSRDFAAIDIQESLILLAMHTKALEQSLENIDGADQRYRCATGTGFENERTMNIANDQ